MSHKEPIHEHHDVILNTPSNNNNTILLSIIAVLLVIIAIIGAFLLGKTLNTDSTPTIVSPNNNTSNTVNNGTVASSLEVKVYSDARCTTADCNTDELISRLQLVPGLANAEFVLNDVSDSDAENYLKENGVTAIPLIVFPTNFIDPGLNQYLEPLKNGEFFLNIGAKYNPFAKRSERGFTMIEESDLEILKEETVYIKGTADSPYIWFEYTNFACPACVSFHKSGIHEEILTAYGDKINFATKHFHFFDDAYPAAELIECAAEQIGTEGFYKLEKDIFMDSITNLDILTQKAVEYGANESLINECLETDRSIATYESVKNNGARIFGVSATPTNILFNLETGEYLLTQNIAADIETFTAK